MKPKLFAAVVGVGVTALAALAPVALAGKPPYTTDVVIDGYSPHYIYVEKRQPDGYDLFGHLDSAQKACEVSRRVVVYRVQSGPDKKLGFDTSDSHGGWSLLIGTANFDTGGTYYAKAPSLKLGHQKSCAADTSNSFQPTP